jgi:hypothetical protein
MASRLITRSGLDRGAFWNRCYDGCHARMRRASLRLFAVHGSTALSRRY